MPENRSRSTNKATLQRAFSKLGICSRMQAEKLIREGRVKVGGRTVLDPDLWIDLSLDRLELDGKPLQAAGKVYLLLNKPRGLVTTRHDPEGRATVFDCLEGLDLPFISPVGRLDKASEGLLLFTNDTLLAQRLLDPATHFTKTYHVQVRGQLGEDELSRLQSGILDNGEWLTADGVRLLRTGARNCWLEITLTEGKNRQIRRMLESLDRDCMRLVRVAIGDIPLGDLPKGEVRLLTETEIRTLRSRAGMSGKKRQA